MLKEAIEFLNPKPGGYFIDCTLGGGGYTMAIAERINENGKVLAIDLDEMAIKNFQFSIFNFQLKNIILANDNFRNLSKIVQESFKDKGVKFDGVVFDLGLSSAQLQDRTRGFSFKSDTPLNMAFGHKRGTDPSTSSPRPELGTKAGQARKNKARNYAEVELADTQSIVNEWTEGELRRILREYGEEKFAGRIARSIVKHRKKELIKTTGQLVKIIKRAVPAQYQHGPIHFATRAFQALRIATNQELRNLEEALSQAANLIKKGGRIVVISYHSLEDRIVKNFFKKENKGCVCPPRFPVCKCGHKATLKILMPKPLTPSEEETTANPRARSAKMRVAEKLAC